MTTNLINDKRLYETHTDGEPVLRVKDFAGGGGGGVDPVGLKNIAATTINPATEDTLSTLNGKVTAVDTGAVTVASSALPTGAATSANQLPDGHNVTVDNASGASAVNIQDGGNSITVDGAVATSPYGLQVALGNITGVANVSKFGRNLDVDTGFEEDVWSQGGSWVAPTTARVHDIVSSNANDTSAGTGARTVEIFGLDSNFDEISETVTMNGTTNVATVNSYTRIFRMIVRTAGTGGQNAGDITATAQTDATVTAVITAAFNQTLMAIYTVPDSKSAYINNVFASVNRQASAGINLTMFVRPENEVWQAKFTLGLNSVGSSAFQRNFYSSNLISGRTDIRISANTSANNADVSAGFDLFIIDN